MAWVAWVVFLNGGTMVATFSLILMVTGAAIAFLVTPAFGLVTAGCVIMSVLYSHDAFRWKSIPGRDLAINIVGYGGATTLSGIMAGQVALGATSISPDLAADSRVWFPVRIVLSSDPDLPARHRPRPRRPDSGFRHRNRQSPDPCHRAWHYSRHISSWSRLAVE